MIDASLKIVSKGLVDNMSAVSNPNYIMDISQHWLR